MTIALPLPPNPTLKQSLAVSKYWLFYLWLEYLIFLGLRVNIKFYLEPYHIWLSYSLGFPTKKHPNTLFVVVLMIIRL